MSKRLPKFKNDKEAVEFWDKTDAADYMVSGEVQVLEWEPAEDRCPRCGNKMDEEMGDINLLEGQVTIRRVKRYRCPACDHEQWSQEFKEKIPLIAKDLIEMVLSR